MGRSGISIWQPGMKTCWTLMQESGVCVLSHTQLQITLLWTITKILSQTLTCVLFVFQFTWILPCDPPPPWPPLPSTTSARRLVPPSPRANKARSAKSHLNGGMNFQPMSRQQNHSPSSAKDSRLICSDFTSPPHSLTPSLSFTLLSTATCCGFFLVTNVLILSHFGQKRLLNALNVNKT